ncbi:MAG: hypothetical protein JNJ40_15335 [Bacteroidia bacterium]|nr:hypothetical protein [Bacteroidia bacterium]
MREFINIQISAGLKTRLKEIVDEINVINEKKKNIQEDVESENRLQQLFLERSNIENVLKKGI